MILNHLFEFIIHLNGWHLYDGGLTFNYEEFEFYGYNLRVNLIFIFRDLVSNYKEMFYLANIAAIHH